MHCHSTASQLSKLGVQRELGLPECATPPEEVYALAKRRGMEVPSKSGCSKGSLWSLEWDGEMFVRGRYEPIPPR